MFNRSKGVAPNAVQGTDVPANPADHQRLRGDLHAAVDRILDDDTGGRPTMHLKRDLHAAISSAVDEHAAARGTEIVAMPDAAPGQTEEARHPVDRVVERLDGVVQRTLGAAKPGMDRSRAYVTAQGPRLIQRLTPVLLDIAADEQRMLQVEQALVGLLKTRMRESRARRVAKLAVIAAKAAAWRKRS
jgi:hypothetical protein